MLLPVRFLSWQLATERRRLKLNIDEIKTANRNRRVEPSVETATVCITTAGKVLTNEMPAPGAEVLVKRITLGLRQDGFLWVPFNKPHDPEDWVLVGPSTPILVEWPDGYSPFSEPNPTADRAQPLDLLDE